MTYRSADHMGVRVVSDEEAEKADAVVCLRVGRPSPFTDNVETTCAWCGTPIFHRPCVPSHPPKVCFECTLERAKGGTA